MASIKPRQHLDAWHVRSNRAALRLKLHPWRPWEGGVLCPSDLARRVSGADAAVASNRQLPAVHASGGVGLILSATCGLDALPWSI